MISVLLPVHAGCALISIILFVWRGLAMWIRRPLKYRFWRRTLPDSVDTVFLSSGVLLALLLGVSPLESEWLAAKIVGLLLYIVLGLVALRGGNMRLKRGAFIIALGVFAYVIAVAHARNPLPWM